MRTINMRMSQRYQTKMSLLYCEIGQCYVNQQQFVTTQKFKADEIIFIKAC